MLSTENFFVDLAPDLCWQLLLNTVTESVTWKPCTFLDVFHSIERFIDFFMPLFIPGFELYKFTPQSLDLPVTPVAIF